MELIDLLLGQHPNLKSKYDILKFDLVIIPAEVGVGRNKQRNPQLKQLLESLQFSRKSYWVISDKPRLEFLREWELPEYLIPEQKKEAPSVAKFPVPKSSKGRYLK